MRQRCVDNSDCLGMLLVSVYHSKGSTSAKAAISPTAQNTAQQPDTWCVTFCHAKVLRTNAVITFDTVQAVASLVSEADVPGPSDLVQAETNGVVRR